MEEAKDVRRGSRKCSPLRGRRTALCNSTHHPLHFHQPSRQTLPALLPLPIIPPMLLFIPRTPLSGSSEAQVALLPIPQETELKRGGGRAMYPSASFSGDSKLASLGLVAARRPDRGGKDGSPISLLANHFLVEFDPKQRVFHYDVDISPRPSKEVARRIKRKLVMENFGPLGGSMPAFDGRKSLYSSVEFVDDKFELFVALPISKTGSLIPKSKLFRVSIRLASRLSGEELGKYLREDESHGVILPQDYLHALDVVLREGPSENCVSMGRSLFPVTTGGGRDIGGGAVGVRGFFQSLRPTQQGLALNLDFSVAAFHESIGVIAYLQKHCASLKELSQRRTRRLSEEERREAERALKGVRVFVCHRETDQRFRVFGLTSEAAEDLRFGDRDGREHSLMEYYKETYGHDIEFKKLPCLQISRSKPCYLPLELCMVCDGQKFMGKLSEDQTAKIFRLGCQRPADRRDAINQIIKGDVGPTRGGYAKEFKLNISTEMTQLQGRVLEAPKLKLGSGGTVRDLTPNRHDRQWSLLNSQVAEGSEIKRWALISFGGTSEQRSSIPGFISRLSRRCEQTGVALNAIPVVAPSFEPTSILSSASALDLRLRKLHESVSGSIQLLIIVMERRHKGYADLKRIAETGIGVVSQCCLYPNLANPTSQFLTNLTLKINAKLGGCNVALYNTIPAQFPRVFDADSAAMFMGADVTHPHPLDDRSPSVAAVVASTNWPEASKYASRMRSQTHRREIIEELEEMVRELLEEFAAESRSLPARIIFFRDGVSETQFRRVLRDELRAIRAACGRFRGYAPAVTFAVVQKRHHTRLFVNDGRRNDENVPPGTIVDSVITHPGEFDFYLCSHWGAKGTSRPAHYHVLWDDNNFKSDEFQKLVHHLCYTFVRCTKPVSLVPPAYYAHLAAYRGRLYLENYSTSSISRPSLPKPPQPLPKIRDSLKKLMFYC